MSRGASSGIKRVWTGFKDFDDIFYEGLYDGCSILLIGYPGSGKTCLASKIVYEAMKNNGCRVAYISFNEEYRVYNEAMKSLGMDFNIFIDKGLFKYIQLPTFASKNLVEEFIRVYTDVLYKFKPKWVIVDSITPLLDVMDVDSVRAFIKNVVYGGESVNKILIGELYYGRKGFSLKGVEFVVDIVLLLTTGVRERFMTRTLRIVKTRGLPVRTNKTRLVISRELGVRLVVPSSVEEIPRPDYSVIYYSGCPAFDDLAGGVPRGAQVLLLYPAGHGIPDYVLATELQYILKYGLKTLFITYSRSLEDIIGRLKHVFKRIGKEPELVGKYINVVSINPVKHGLSEILIKVYNIIDDYKPDILVIQGLRNLYDIYGYSKDLILYTYMSSLMLRSRGITVLRKIAYTRKDEYNPAMEFSDIVLRIEYSRDTSGRYRLVVLRTGVGGRPGFSISLDRLKSCYRTYNMKH